MTTGTTTRDGITGMMIGLTAGGGIRIVLRGGDNGDTLRKALAHPVAGASTSSTLLTP